ncbi:MAG: energy transducer TonB [Paludibacteraceae bacterium]|nr:energy transducer TonB [Paludibacteraceae bacterium]
MYKGKKTCETLKSIRKQIADANDIPYEPVVCTHKGDCMGTCPACESEMRYIENQLNIRKMAGKAVKIVGLATMMTMAACNSISSTDRFNPNMEVDAGDEMEGEIVDFRRVGVEDLPEKPFVPVEDTVYAEGEDLFDEIVHAECPYDIVDFLINNLNYPITKLKSDTLVETPVVVIFNVEDDGSISNVRVKEPVHPDFDKEAIRVVQKMENWKPAMSNGRLVRSKFHVTILLHSIPEPSIPQYANMPVLGFMDRGEDKDSTSCKKEMVSKSDSDDDDDDMIMGMIVEQKPVFPGGQKALMEFLKSNLVYPKAAQDSSIQGRVIVKFTIEKDGSITDVEVVRGVHPALDEEAVRVVSMMPKWKPGTQMGDTVRTKFTLPVLFKINQEESKK